MGSEYQAVPVATAREIGAKFDKQIVVIVCWEDTTGKLHTTTWGDRARHKDWAADLGVKLAAAAGGDMTRKKENENFADPSTAALNAERAARLTEALTPSAETKAAYHGEFHFDVARTDEEGNEHTERQTVPWTTVKEIMAAILARADKGARRWG